MRIVHVSDFYLPRVGGIEMHVHDLATRQAATGHRVEVITSSPGSDDRLDGPGVRVHRVRPGRQGSVFHPLAPRAGRSLLRQGGYDVAHVHATLLSPMAFAGAQAAAGAGIPTVVTLHSLLGGLRPAFGLLDRLTHWRAWPVEWTAVSEVAAAPLQRLLGPRMAVGVLPNGVDAAQWRADPLERDPRDVLAIAVMRLTPRKRPLHLLRMLRHARQQLPAEVGLRAVIVGEGPERRSLERYLHRHRLGDMVSLPGTCSRERIRRLFQRADLFVAPANLESFGIAALEARCAGLPVVAKAAGGIHEFVCHGSNGFLANSDREMADAIAWLAGNPAVRQAIAARNRAVHPPFAWPDTMFRVEAAYARAARRAPTPAEALARMASAAG